MPSRKTRGGKGVVAGNGGKIKTYTCSGESEIWTEAGIV